MRMLFLLVYICSFWNQRVDWRHKGDSSLPVLRYWLCHWREFRISDNKSIFIKDERILVLNRQIPACRNKDASILHVCKWRTASKMYICFSPKCPKKPVFYGNASKLIVTLIFQWCLPCRANDVRFAQLKGEQSITTADYRAVSAAKKRLTNKLLYDMIRTSQTAKCEVPYE